MNARNLGMAIAGVLVLGGCATQGPVVYGVNGSYDHLGSCFYRLTRQANDMSHTAKMDRLSDPDEFDISEYNHFLWSGNSWNWTVKFVKDGPSRSTVIEKWKGPRVAWRDRMTRRVKECVQKG
jgi:hypothetical protein